LQAGAEAVQQDDGGGVARAGVAHVEAQAVHGQEIRRRGAVAIFQHGAGFVRRVEPGGEGRGGGEQDTNDDEGELHGWGLWTAAWLAARSGAGA
jgi:hypothetical protein